MNVGTLTIEIAANVARLQVDMDATKRSVQGAMKDVEQYVGFAKTAFVALTGVAGVGAFAGLISSSISAKAKLQDLSLQTGMSVESLASLQKIGKFSATSIEEVTSASNKLSKAMATSNEDSKGAALAIEALGLNFAQFQGLNADERLNAVARAMDTFKDGTGKTAAAMLLFGKQGAELLPFMKELVERQGLVGDTTTAAAKAAKDYEDNIVALQLQMNEWKEQLVNDILPSLVKVSAELVNGRKAYGSFIAATLDLGTLNPFNGLTENVRAANAEYAKLGEQADAIRKRQGEGGLGAQAMRVADEQRLREIASLQAVIDQRRAYFRELEKEQGGGRGSVVPGRVGDDARPELKIDAGAVERDKKALADKLRLEKELATEAKRRAQEFAALVGPMREKLALDQMELDMGRSLTSSEREALDVMVQIRDGKLQLTDARKRELVATLEQRAGAERLNEARKAEAKWIEEARAAEEKWLEQRAQASAKWLEESARENERALEGQTQRLRGLEDEGRALQQMLDDYGLTREQLQALTSARMRDGAAAMLQQRGVEDFNPDQAAMNRLLEEQAALLQRNADARDALTRRDVEAVNRAKRERTDPSAGAARALKEYREEIENLGDSTYQVVGGTLRSLEDGFTDLFTKGKFDARSFVDTLIREFVRLQVVQPMMKNLLGGGGGGGLGSLFGGGSQLGTLFGGGSSTGGFGFGTGAGFGNMDLGAFAANGMAFDGVHAFARGGIVDSPTLFKFANGGAMRNGLMGEAGPEAILPLTRSPSGKLGVAGGGGGSVVNVTQNLSIGAGVSPSQLAQAMAQAKDQAKAEIQDQMRRGSRAYQ